MANETHANLLTDNVNKLLSTFIPVNSRQDIHPLYAKIGVQSHGTITFPENKSNRAQFIRVPPTASVFHIKELLTRLWCKGRPSFVISIVGGMKEYNMKPKLLRAFRRGLLKVARTTGAWIITNGLNTGLTKLVGEIVQINPDRSRPIHLIGIAPWGCVSNFQQLDVHGANVHYAQPRSDQKGEAPLEPNHTEFIFVDDGCVNKYGREIAFRSKLEQTISNGFFATKTTTGSYDQDSNLQATTTSLRLDNSAPVPVVLLVVEGGPNTIRTVHESVVQNNVPAVLFDGTGRCCDLFAKAYRFYYKEFYNDTSTDDDPDVLEQRHTDFKNKLRELVRGELERTVPGYDHMSKSGHTTDYFELVYECIHTRKHLLNIVTLDSHNAVEPDIDLVILQTLLNATSGSDIASTSLQRKREQLHLALEWNRVDIAKKYIMKSDSDWKNININDLFLSALDRNQIEFVKLFLDHDFPLTDLFRNNDRLLSLYRNHLTSTFPWTKSSINDSLRAIYQEIIQPLIGDFFEVDAIFPIEEDIGVFSTPSTQEYIDVDKELFLWSIITGRHDFALLFWLRGINMTCGALIATLIYRKRARQDNDYSYDQHADKYENLAVHILNKFYEINPGECIKAMIRKIPTYGNVTWLELAIAAGAQQFIAQRPVQDVLNNIWYGYIDQRVSGKRIIFSTIMLWYSGFLPYRNELVKTNEERIYIEDSSQYQSSKEKQTMYSPKDAVQMRLMQETSDLDEDTAIEFVNVGCCEKTGTSIARYFRNIIVFTHVPYVKYLYDLYFTAIFLLLFSYVLLCDLVPLYNFPDDVCGPIQVRPYNRDHNLPDAKNSTSSQPVRVNRPAISEIILVVWVFTLFCEEVRQFFSIEAQSFRNALRAYFKVFWNTLDFVGIILFIIGITLRYLPSVECYCAARIVLSFDLTIWFIRSLNIFTFVKRLGPKLVMMGEMIYDLKFFLLILSVIILAFGISSYSFIYGVQNFSWHMPREIINFIFWQIFGEFNALDTFEHNYTASGYAAFVLLVAYMIIVSIFLVNFLIAMFSNTFDRLQMDTDRVWKYQRYSLVCEYLSRPALPPPFIFFAHLYRLILFILGRCLKFRYFSYKYDQHISRMNYKIMLDEATAARIEKDEDALADEVYYSTLKTDQDTSQNMFNEIQTLKNQIQTIGNQQAHMIEYLECLMDSLHENQG